MRKFEILLVLVLLTSIIALLSCSKGSNSHVDKKELKTAKDSMSFAYGYLSGLQAKSQDKVDINPEIFSRAFQQAYNGDTNSTMNTTEATETFEKYARMQQEAMQEETAKKAEPNIAAAENFLKENKNKQGVKETASGLQYKVIKQGKGAKPVSGRGDRIRFLYSLSYLDKDGKMHQVHSDFDDPNTKPQLMGIDNFISGFVEGTQMMNAGSRYILWLHPSLGYGYQDLEDIPAGSLLMFDIEVVDVIPNVE